MIPQTIREARDTRIGRSELQREYGHDAHAERNANAADRWTRRLDRAYAHREAALAALLDAFPELTDDEILSGGGVVVYVRGMRVLGLTPDQAAAQYGRVREFLWERGVLNDPIEWYVRDVYLHLLGFPTDRVKA